MRKRFLAVLLATAMATTMIVGCGDQNRSNYEDDDDDDDDEDDEDDEDDDDEDDDDGEDIVAEYDDMFEVSPDSILYGEDFDVRVLYGEYVVDGEDFYSDEYYVQFKENVKDSMEIVDPYWGDTIEVCSMLQKIEVGKFSEFWGNIYYENSDGTYTSYCGEGRYSIGIVDQEDLRVEKEMLLDQYGAAGIEYYNNMMESFDLDFAIIEFPVFERSYSVSVGALVEAEGNKLHFYNYEYNEDKTVTRLEEIFNCRFDFKGAKLEISKNDVVFELVPYDFRKSSYSHYIYNGPSFVANKNEAYADLCGITLADDGDNVIYVSHGYFTDGSECFSDYDNQIFECDIESGRFKLTYAPNYVYNGSRWMFDDEPRYKTASGQFLWGGGDHGLVLKIDDELYYYQHSKEDYYYDVFGYNGMGDDSDDGADSGSLAASINIHEQVSNDLSEAFGDDAVIDENSGAITMDNNILFAVDSAEISAEGKEYLDDFIVTYLTAIKPYLDDGSVTSIVIEGHTDTDGTYEYNLDLSERRAQAVADYVIERQPELADCTITIGYSFLYPIYDDNGNVDKAASRRVVFSFRTQ